MTNKIVRASDFILGFIFYWFQMITQEKHLIMQQKDGGHLRSGHQDSLHSVYESN